MMDKPSVVRVLVLISGLLGYFQINVPENTIEWIASIIVSVVGLYTAYKNNYLFDRGVMQKEALKQVDLYKSNK